MEIILKRCMKCYNDIYTMKTKLFPLLFAIVASVGTIFAEKVKIGDLYYNLDVENKTAEVTRGIYSGSIVIPENITYDSVTYSVTIIGASAFYGSDSLASVSIPNSVTSIGEWAFRDCSGLASIEIPNSVTSIGAVAFGNCTGLTSIEIPNSVTSIGERVFSGCTGLTSMTIPSSVTSIGYGTFSGCTSLTSVTIPNGITSIGSNAFSGCIGLTSIEIPNSVTSIEESAFYYCYGLTSFSIPHSVISIGERAFKNCIGLTSVSIPNSVTSIGNNAFAYCTGLTSVTINSNAIVSKNYTTNSNMKSIFGAQVEEYILGADVKSIGNYAFFQCDSLSTVTIGDSIKSIGIHAFAECAKLNSITWNAKSCDDFTNYSPFYPLNIESFTFGNEVEKIPAYLCSRLYNVGNIVIPNSVTSIGDCAFEYCNLTSITIPNSVIHIGDNVLSNCSGITHPVYNASHFVRLPLDYSGEFSIQSGITTICGGAFVACYYLTSVSIPNSVTKIGNNAFGYCTGLTSMTIPNSVTSIESNAFRNCSSLTSIIIPNSVQNCTWRISLHNENLKNIEAPTWFFDVAESNWASCPKYLQSMTINAGEINDNVFGVISRSYKTLTNLNIANTTNTNIADEAFKGYYNLTTLALPSNLEHIGYMSVADCKSLQSIHIPASVEEIDNSAFENCRSLKTITFGGQAANISGRFNAPATYDSQLQRIGNWAFYNCHELQNLTIPEGVTEIGDGAFYGCVYLEDLILPTSVQSIGDNTFALCSKLQKIIVNATTPPAIQTKTFYDVKRRIPVYVPDEVVEQYEDDPLWGEFDIVGVSNLPSNIDNVITTTKANKLIRNGQILILRGDHTYTLQGQELK